MANQPIKRQQPSVFSRCGRCVEDDSLKSKVSTRVEKKGDLRGGKEEEKAVVLNAMNVVVWRQNGAASLSVSQTGIFTLAPPPRGGGLQGTERKHPASGSSLEENLLLVSGVRGQIGQTGWRPQRGNGNSNDRSRQPRVCRTASRHAHLVQPRKQALGRAATDDSFFVVD